MGRLLPDLESRFFESYEQISTGHELAFSIRDVASYLNLITIKCTVDLLTAGAKKVTFECE